MFVLLQNKSLYGASERGDLEEVQRLVNKKANVNWPHPYDVSHTLSIYRAGIEMVINQTNVEHFGGEPEQDRHIVL